MSAATLLLIILLSPLLTVHSMKTKYPYTDSKFTRIARDFKASEFRASWFDNEHYQTIVGSEALRLKVFGSYPREFKTRRESIYTPDGDSFSVDYTLDTMNDSKPIVLVLHGLESNTQGPLVTKMTTAFIQKGFCCCLISFRGCDGTDNNTPGAYHLGFTNDLDFLIKQIINKKYPNKRIYLAGFSLGGNVCLKYLGEMGERATAHNLYGAAVTSVPFDPVASQGKLDKPGFNRQVYSANFLNTLKDKAERQILKFPGAFDIEAIRACTTIGDFDNAFIAPIYGFKDKVDYYRKTGSKWWLNKIRVPAVAINAVDDPFIEASSLPTNEDVGVAPVRLIYHSKGGHCGFVGRNVQQPHGWIAEELGRALQHIHTACAVESNADESSRI